MENQRGRALRRRVAEHGGGRGKKYPEALRADVGAWVRQGRADGVAWQELKQEIGLSLESLRRWSGLGAQTRSKRVVEVEVVRDGGGVCVVSPTGYRVEGLSLEGAATLLRALS